MDTKEYKPRDLKEVDTNILNKLKNTIKNQNFDDEADSLDFCNIRELEKGTYTAVNLVKTNPIIFGKELKIAMKTIIDKSENSDKTSKAKLEFERSEQEFDLLYNIDHPNIMKSYFKWKANNEQLKIGLEYLPCKDLKELVKQYEKKKHTKKLPLELVRFYAVEMVKALGYMRKNKVLHRDIKPCNVMLDHSFHVKLANFGLGVKYDENDKESRQSKIYDEASNTVKYKSKELLEKVEKELMKQDNDSDSEFEAPSQSSSGFSSPSKGNFSSSVSSSLELNCGTTPYKAPEIHLLGAGSHEADVWAMGVMIYELLAGHLLWEAYQIGKMICAKFSFPEDFDESAKELINECLIVDPSKRIG